ncbi:DUF3040 domain-containing protein [Streptomyces sp. NPDC048370]|uniref:DUF3040 domain-containing protein n=1 Tax=Streptomyces sp. NPDC048370 TaxID=3365540 RepID=UPI003723B03F
MSHPADDERILADMERGLTHDDPALSATMETLNQQFPEQPERPAKARLSRRDPRLVTAVVLTVIALLALILTAALNSPPAPHDGEVTRPAAHSAEVTTHQ